MKKIIKKYYLSLFYIITFMFSFFLLTFHFLFKSAGNYSISFAQFAPAFSVVLLSFILKDKNILYEIRNHLYLKSNSVKWLIPAIFLPVICITVSSIIMSFLKINYVPWEGKGLFYILNIAAILAGCFAEEIGWRGFLLPQLQKKHSSIISSIIVGILWGIWHLNFRDGILGFILYGITIIEMSILMTWLYNKTNGNLLLMIVWHFMFSLSSNLFLWQRFNISMYTVQGIVFGIVCVAVLLAESKYSANRHNQILER